MFVIILTFLYRTGNNILLQVKKKLLELTGRNLALDELVGILERESVQQREQFTAERLKIAALQENIFDLKVQLSQNNKINLKAT